MTGHSPYYRIGYPNVYDKAYQAYLEDNAKHLTSLMSLKNFKEEVHNYSSNTAMRPYVELVYSDENTIDMVDPSGGPYIGSGANMGRYSEEFEGMIVKEFERIDTGYKIIIK
jgi:hypothetical protein